MRLIDADELLKCSRRGKIIYLDDNRTDGYVDVLCTSDVVKLPTIEAEPIRYAKWELKQSGACDYDCVCSACGESGVPRNNYCSNCGAKMTNVNEF